MSALKNVKKGFTLIELMIVVAIIGILASIAIPSFLKFQCKSKQSEAKTALKATYTTQLAYNGEFGTYLPLADLTIYGGLDPRSVQGKFYAFGAGAASNTFVASATDFVKRISSGATDGWQLNENLSQPSQISNACQ